MSWVMLAVIIVISSKIDTAKNTKKLNSYVKQAEEEMNAGDYEAAYNTAGYINWYDEYDSEKQKEWNFTRKRLVDKIMEAEKADTGTVTYEPETETETETETVKEKK